MTHRKPIILILLLAIVLALAFIFAPRILPKNFTPTSKATETLIYLNQTVNYGPLKITLKEIHPEDIDDIKTGKIWTANVATVAINREGALTSHSVIKGNAINPPSYRILIKDVTTDTIKVAITQN